MSGPFDFAPENGGEGLDSHDHPRSKHAPQPDPLKGASIHIFNDTFSLPSSIFWLVTRPHLSNSASSSARFSNLYVRLHGSGSNAVLLTPQPPKFLRSHLSPANQVIFTSWAEKHRGRNWGFVLGNEDSGKSLGGWAPMEIVEGQGTSGFRFAEDRPGERKEEGLKYGSWNGEGKKLGTGAAGEGGRKASWAGWMVCEWTHGHPQLFWMTDDLQKDLPAYCERVILERVPVIGQGDDQVNHS